MPTRLHLVRTQASEPITHIPIFSRFTPAPRGEHHITMRSNSSTRSPFSEGCTYLVRILMRAPSMSLVPGALIISLRYGTASFVNVDPCGRCHGIASLWREFMRFPWDTGGPSETI